MYKNFVIKEVALIEELVLFVKFQNNHMQIKHLTVI